MALDLGLTTHQLLSALDGVVDDAIARNQRLDDAIARASSAPADDAAFRTAAVGRRPYISARTGSEGLLGSISPPEVPNDWTSVSVDGSHIDVDRHLPLRCFLVNLGGCAITYGKDFGCHLFSEPALAVEDDDLYLRPPDGGTGETLIAGPLLSALRTVREVEQLADTVESLPSDRPVLALLDGTLAFWDLQRGQYPRYVADTLIKDRLSRALARLRDASQDGRPVAVVAYTSRPRTTEAAGAVRLMLCDQGDADCDRLCTARHSRSEVCDGAAGFDDRELFELVLEPGHRSPLYRSSHLAARFALGLATGQEWSHFYYLNGGTEIARVEVPDWLAQDPELLALSHAMLVRQCDLGLGYPVAISEAHEQAVITGHDREEFRRTTLMLLEQRGLSTHESAKSFSKRRPWV
ncbi:MAG: DNA double-strand break repair nuclease NurA [Gemmatimonadota bacterium]|nr:DNA double-strand break repair nuclease NurA [Gemmatimonadota bacterium]